MDFFNAHRVEMNCTRAGFFTCDVRIRWPALIAVYFCCALLGASVCFGARYTVFRVYSGDTIKVEDSDTIVQVRLAGIDAPETGEDLDSPGQPLSEESRVYLSGLIFKTTVDVVSYGYDIENRIIGAVFLGEKNINLEMVRAGLAEVYPGKAPPGFDLNPFRRAEKSARAANKGIWSLGEAYVRPEQWRKQQDQIPRLADLPEIREIVPKTDDTKASAGTGMRKDTSGVKKPEVPEDAESAAVAKGVDPGAGTKHPKTVVNGIDIEIGPTSEKVLVYLNGFSLPKAFDIDGEDPRIVIDIRNVGAYKGQNRIPSNGKLIRQIRTYLHKAENRLRIVLDLNVDPFRDYSISQLYDVGKHTYRLEIK